MTDYGRPVQFGYFLTPDAASYPRLIEQARLADELGLDLIGVQDHPYQRRFLDTWTLLTSIAVQTTHVRLFPDVANLPLRPPAIMAKTAASLDVMTGGRVELGIGAGSFWDAVVAMGGPRRAPRDAVAAVEEAITVVRLMWREQGAARFTGRFYTLAGVRPGPLPAHPIGIWIGALGPKMLDLTGRLADGWVPSSPYAPPDALPEMQRRIDAAAASAGRDPAAIQRLYNVAGHITDGPSCGFLDGPVDRWVDDLARLTLEVGMDTYLLMAAEPIETQLRRFALEVAPRVREVVAQQRASAHMA